MSRLDLFCSVGITSNQRLSFIRNYVSAGAGYSTVQKPAIRGIHSKNVEHSGTHDTAMVLDCLFVFRHSTLRECPGFNAAGIDSSGDYFDIAVMVMFRMQKVLLLATMAHTAL
jgi:hypothetical protein